MSTVTYFSDKSSSVGGIKSGVFKKEELIDFTLNPCLSGDVVECINVDAGDIILSAGLKVITGETGTVEFGYGTDPDYFVTSQSVATSGTVVANGASVTADSLAFTASDTLDLVLGADLDTAKVSVYAIIAKLEN